jgi:hypothetical protein
MRKISKGSIPTENKNSKSGPPKNSLQETEIATGKRASTSMQEVNIETNQQEGKGKAVGKSATRTVDNCKAELFRPVLQLINILHNQFGFLS